MKVQVMNYMVRRKGAHVHKSAQMIFAKICLHCGIRIEVRNSTKGLQHLVFISRRQKPESRLRQQAFLGAWLRTVTHCLLYRGLGALILHLHKVKRLIVSSLEKL